MLVHHYY